MHTLKLKINQKFEDEILKYQREYSSVFHCAFELLNEEPDLQSVFNYIKSNSKIIKKINELNNVELMNSWFMQSCIKESYSLVESFKLKKEEYLKKMQRKSELEQKSKLLKVEKKEIRHLQKLKEPKVIFGRKKTVQ